MKTLDSPPRPRSKAGGGAVMSPDHVSKLLAEMGKSSEEGDGPAWRTFHARAQVAVRIGLPLGELTQPALSGLLWGLCLDPRSPVFRFHPDSVASITPMAPGLATQGIEGVLWLDATLMTALLIAQEVGPFRIAVKTAVVTGNRKTV